MAHQTSPVDYSKFHRFLDLEAQQPDPKQSHPDPYDVDSLHYAAIENIIHEWENKYQQALQEMVQKLQQAETDISRLEHELQAKIIERDEFKRDVIFNSLSTRRAWRKRSERELSR